MYIFIHVYILTPWVRPLRYWQVLQVDVNGCENIHTLVVASAVRVSKCVGCANVYTASASPASRCVWCENVYTYEYILYINIYMYIYTYSQQMSVAKQVCRV